MENKSTLYQRVLTRPGAEIVADPGASPGDPVPPLSRYYVYERRDAGGERWLLVGAGSRGDTAGWIREGATLPWEQQMTLAFTNPAGRERTLLFDTGQTVADLLQAPNPGAAAAPIREAVTSGKGDPRVVSIEPETHIDLSEQFYLLPILNAREVDTASGFRARVLEVASVTKEPDAPTPLAPQAEAEPKELALRTFSAALVFVIDSTISMGPYIERTRAAVRRIYETIDTAGLQDQVAFGLVAYRSSTEAVAGLEYVSKVFVDPNEVRGAQDFLQRIEGLQPAAVSSARFEEDAYAGVLAAVEGIEWSRFGGRYIVLITDAGAIEGGDRLSTTGLGAAELRLELERLGIALYALHLKTPAGRRNHAAAERQYEELSRNPVIDKPLYYPVEAGAVGPFGAIVDSLASAIAGQVENAAQGKIVPGSARTARRDGDAGDKAGAGKADGVSRSDDPQARIAADTEKLGLAMQLAYLGRVQGTAPPLFRAWLSDRAFADLDRPTTEVRVLLTKNQLNDLAQVVETILDAGDRSQQTSTADFFDLIRSASANIARDPAALNDPDATRLGELGLLGEYLEDLPYKSDVMSLSRDVWSSWSFTQQEELLDTLRRKLRYYQLYHDDVDRWVSLAPGADPGEAVYPVPLRALP
jgi:hypothetical protein